MRTPESGVLVSSSPGMQPQTRESAPPALCCDLPIVPLALQTSLGVVAKQQAAVRVPRGNGAVDEDADMPPSAEPPQLWWLTRGSSASVGAARAFLAALISTAPVRTGVFSSCPPPPTPSLSL